MSRLVEELQELIPTDICKFYWDSATDHEDFNNILNAIDSGGGQTCDIVGVLKELHKAGYGIMRIKK